MGVPAIPSTVSICSPVVSKLRHSLPTMRLPRLRSKGNNTSNHKVSGTMSQCKPSPWLSWWCVTATESRLTQYNLRFQYRIQRNIQRKPLKTALKITPYILFAHLYKANFFLTQRISVVSVDSRYRFETPVCLSQSQTWAKCAKIQNHVVAHQISFCFQKYCYFYYTVSHSGQHKMVLLLLF